MSVKDKSVKDKSVKDAQWLQTITTRTKPSADAGHMCAL